MVNVVTEAGDEESQHLLGREEGELVAVLMEQVAEVCDGESMEPVMVGGVTIALLYHQQKPRGGWCMLIV